MTEGEGRADIRREGAGEGLHTESQDQQEGGGGGEEVQEVPPPPPDHHVATEVDHREETRER